MSLTIWGLFILLISVFILIFRGFKGIVEAFIFTSPLFITVVTTIPLGDTVLRTSYFFAILFIVLFLGDRALRDFNVPSFKKDLLPAYLFLLVITLSIFMPLFLERDIYVLSFNSNTTFGVIESLFYEKLEFRQSNLTQLIYPYFQVILFALLALYLQKEEQITDVLRLLIKGMYVVLATGFIYLTLVQLGTSNLLQSVHFIITGRESFGYSIGVGGFLDLPRMFSWAGEPGYTSFFLLAILGFLTAPIVTGNYILNKGRKATLFLFCLVLAGIIISSGTTGYIGLIILLVIVLALASATNSAYFKIKTGYLVAPIAFITLILVGIYSVTEFSFLEYFLEYHWSKLTELTGSGMTRFYVVKNNFLNFLQSPILGLGYGSVKSVAFGAYLLANAGLLGFLSFTYWALYLMKKMWNILKSEFSTQDQKTLAFGLLVSFATMFALMQFAKSAASLLFHYFWIIAACMLALHRIFKKQKREIL